MSSGGMTADYPLQRLTAVSRALTYAASLDEVLEITVATAQELLGVSPVILMLKDEDGELAIRASRGVDPDAVSRFRQSFDEGLIFRLTAVLGPDAKDRFLGVPLVVRGKVTGLLGILQGAEPGPRDERLLSALADQASVALEAARREVTSSDLEHRVKELEAGEARHERAMQIVGHDIRTPLNSLRGYLDLLHQEVYGPINERQREALERLETITGHLDSLVHNALAMSSIAAGRLSVSCVPLDVETIVEQAVDVLSARLEDTRVSLSIEVQDGLVARADAGCLRQVVIQLVDNAIKHSPPEGEIAITASREPGPPEGIAIRVSDEGPGIDPEHAEEIFEPYRRLDDSSEGFGLGLPIALAMAELMQGELVLEDDGSSGATFLVRLPGES